MAKKTHPHKRSSVRKAARRKPSALSSWTYRSRNKIALAVIVLALLATASVAYWKAPDNEVVAPAPVISETANKSPVKDVPTFGVSLQLRHVLDEECEALPQSSQLMAGVKFGAEPPQWHKQFIGPLPPGPQVSS